jgi:hypothetical protein
MSSIKCPNCGLVSFATAPDCKRCHAKFLAPPPDAAVMAMPNGQFSFSQNTAFPPQPVAFQPLPEYHVEAPPIGGWLIVFAIGLAITLGLCALLLPEYINILSSKAYYMLTTEGSPIYASSFSSAFTFEFSWLVAIGIASILMLIRFFRKSSSFPRMAIFILAATIVVAFIDYLLALNVEHQLTEKLAALSGSRGKVPPLMPGYITLFILYSILSSIAWIAYFKNSRRVEATFIN